MCVDIFRLNLSRLHYTWCPKERPLRIFATYLNGIFQNFFLNSKVSFILTSIKKEINLLSYDAYHDTKQKGKSVGALIASINKECTRVIIFINRSIKK